MADAVSDSGVATAILSISAQLLNAHVVQLLAGRWQRKLVGLPVDKKLDGDKGNAPRLLAEDFRHGFDLDFHAPRIDNQQAQALWCQRVSTAVTLCRRSTQRQTCCHT